MSHRQAWMGRVLHTQGWAPSAAGPGGDGKVKEVAV
jgi:hypothetical protein